MLFVNATKAKHIVGYPKETNTNVDPVNLGLPYVADTIVSVPVALLLLIFWNDDAYRYQKEFFSIGIERQLGHRYYDLCCLCFIK